MELTDHNFRLANISRMRGAFWGDWQLDEGAKMDAPQWSPRGSTKGEVYNSSRTWVLRTGHVLRFTPASHQTVYVRLDGQLYRTEWEAACPGDNFLSRMKEARRASKRARTLSRSSRMFRMVEDLARRQVHA